MIAVDECIFSVHRRHQRGTVNGALRAHHKLAMISGFICTVVSRVLQVGAVKCLGGEWRDQRRHGDVRARSESSLGLGLLSDEVIGHEATQDISEG